MDSKTYISQVSELKVMSDLACKGYHIFNQISGKAPFDLIACKGESTIRISVKSTSRDINKAGKYSVELRRIRSNTKSNVVHKIIAKEFDIMAVYIEKEDKVVYLSIDNLIGRSSINIDSSMSEIL